MCRSEWAEVWLSPAERAAVVAMEEASHDTAAAALSAGGANGLVAK